MPEVTGNGIWRAYLVTGDDELDDPAWGAPLMWEGRREQLRAWLKHQPQPDQISLLDDAGGWHTGPEELARAAH